MSKEKNERINMLQQIAINNALDYPKLKSDTNLIFLGSLFVELTELGGSIPEQLQSIIAESIRMEILFLLSRSKEEDQHHGQQPMRYVKNY